MKRQSFRTRFTAWAVLAVMAAGLLAGPAGIAVSAKKMQINGVDDIAGKKIGVQLGTTGDIYSSDYEGDDAGTKVERFNKGADAIQALNQKKIDCVIIDEQPAKAFVAKNPDLTILKQEFVTEDYAICVSKKNPELTSELNKYLSELKDDGTIDSIISNYIGNETGKHPYKTPSDAPEKDGDLIMATNAEFPPYEFYEDGSDSTPVGIDVDIARAIADRMGKNLKVQDIQFDAIITAVEGGKADMGMAGMTVTDERKKNIDFTDSYTTSKQVIIVRSENTKNGTGSAVKKQSLGSKFRQNFIEKDRYMYLVRGLGTTLLITVFAVIIGIVLGVIIGIIRVTHDKNGSFAVLNWLCKLYLTVVRGTPMMVQLLIVYYVIFASADINKIIVAIIAFGLNSAAYVAEVFRSGIMSIDNGQYEAGMSLGLTFGQTMRSIVLPQGFRNVLPALGNEFISLLKETSIAGYIGIQDLTKGGDIIRSTTWEAFMPLVSVALIYLLIVMLLTHVLTRLERRLKTDER